MRFSDARDDRGAARRTSRAATRPKTVLGRAESRRRRATPSSAGGLAARRRSTRGAAAVEARRSCRERDGARAIRAELDGRRSGARRKSGARGRRRARLGPPGGEGRTPRGANGAVFGRTASRRDEIFRREGRSRCRAPNLARGDAPRRLCSAAQNRGWATGPRLRAPAVSRRAGGRRAALAAVEARRSCRERGGARAIRAELDGRRSGARRESGARGDAALAWAARRRGRTLAGEWRRLRGARRRGAMRFSDARGRSRCRAPNLARGDAPEDCARPRRIAAATGHAFERRAVSRRAGGRRAARPRSKRVVPAANATAHERFAPSSTAAGAARGGKVALEATPRSPGPPGGEGERRRLHTAMAPSSGAVGGHDSTKNSKRDETFFGEWSYNGRLYHKSLWSYRCIDRVRYRLRSVGVVKVIGGTSCSSALTSSSSSSTLASSSLFPY